MKGETGEADADGDACAEQGAKATLHGEALAAVWGVAGCGGGGVAGTAAVCPLADDAAACFCASSPEALLTPPELQTPADSR